MGRDRRGAIRRKDGKIYARLVYFDNEGNKKEKQQRVANITEGRELLKKMIRELDDHGSKHLDAAKMTFEELAAFYQENYITKPKYKDGRKISGLRGKRQVDQQLNTVKKHFGAQKIRSITYASLEKYKNTRLNTEKPRKDATQPIKTLSVAYINRELALIRRMFNVAVQQGWLTKNPFSAGTGLVSAADEVKRERIVTKEEEARLLEFCVGRRAHLRPVIICALDTGMRYSEIAKLTWIDIDLFNKVIKVQALNTKTLKSRQVPITTRLEQELNLLWKPGKQLTDKVFGIGTTIKTPFGNARTDAGLSDLHFHDLRHTAATRMIEAGVPLQQVGRILGHTQANTTYRYVNANADTAKQVAKALDAWHEEEKEGKQELLN